MIQQTGAWMVGIVDKKNQTHIGIIWNRVSIPIMTTVSILPILSPTNITTATARAITKVMKSFWQTMMVVGSHGYSTKPRNKANIVRLRWKS